MDVGRVVHRPRQRARVETGLTAGLEEHLLAPGHEVDRRRQRVRDRGGNDHRAVPVGMDQIVGVSTAPKRSRSPGGNRFAFIVIPPARRRPEARRRGGLRPGVGFVPCRVLLPSIQHFRETVAATTVGIGV